MSTFFISHSSKDNIAAAMMRDRLAERQFKSLFLDFDPANGIPVGQSWERTLYRQLQACDVVLVLFSDNHLASNWCFAEVALARMQGKHVITLLIDPLTDRSTLPSILREHQYLDLRQEANHSLDRLWRGLSELGIENEPTRQWDPYRPPYPGMLAFTENEAPVFFGREPETREVIEILNAARRRESDRVLKILGGSGSGKSSVVRAGVIPRLRRDPQWLVIEPFRPGREPIEELAARLIRSFKLQPGEMKELIDELKSTSIAEVLARLRRTSDNPEATPLLVIDQFEELLGPEEGASTEFLHLLDAACASDKLPVQILLTLRSDFMGELQARQDLPALLGSHQGSYSVGPMQKEALRKVITQPAELCALEIEEGLVDRLLADTGTPDALPLLAFALRVLWDRGHEDGALTMKEYEELGGFGGAISKEADAALAEVKQDPEIYKQLRTAFVRMSRLGENGGYARATSEWKDHPASIHAALQRFVAKRILVSRTENDVALLEIAHEALFRNWTALAGWLEEDAEVLRLRELVRNAAQRWNQDHDENDLLRGTRLSRVNELLQEGRLLLKKEELEFLDQSARFEKERLLKEGNLIGAVLADPSLKSLVEPKLKRAIEEIIEEQNRREKESVFGYYDVAARGIAENAKILENVISETPRWHPQPAVMVGNTGASRNYVDVYQFPCCGLTILQDGGPSSQFRSDGCEIYDPTKDKPAPQPS